MPVLIGGASHSRAPSTVARCKPQPSQPDQPVEPVGKASCPAERRVAVSVFTSDGAAIWHGCQWPASAKASELAAVLARELGTELAALRLFSRGRALQAEEEPLCLSAELVLDQLPQTVRQPDRSLYCGPIRHGLFEGCGVLHSANGDVFEGQFSSGRMHGEGELQRSSGERYTGGFQEDRYHGWGRRSHPDGSTYEGRFERGVPEGHGTLRYSDGFQYRGNFLAGMMHGQGSYVAPDGFVVYQGEFRQDAQEGEGTYRSRGGAVYEGQFRADMPHGRGRWALADGRVTEGLFEGERLMRCCGSPSSYDSPDSPDSADGPAFHIRQAGG